MKKVLFLTAILLATVAPCLAARTQTNDHPAAVAPDKTNTTVAPASENLETGVKPEAKTEPQKTDKAEKKKKSDAQKTADKKKKSDAHKTAEPPSTASVAPISAATDINNATSDAPSKTIDNIPVGAPPVTGSNTDPSKAHPTASTPGPTVNAPAPSAPAAAAALTSTYRVGIGDVLDIRLLNATTSESTLFTVLAGGMLEYPLAGEAVAVGGLTTEEINAQLTPKIKLYDDPRLAVSVREYASHRVIVTGLVNDPGTKVLRREAVPLYVVLAEAQPRTEAARATIMRQGAQSITVDLADSTATSALVLSGDVIRLTAAPPPQPQFYFVGGYINLPGQKDFHKGLTLMQAVLASGGTSRFAGSEVKVMRQGEDGKLITTRYNLKRIEEGKIPDPVLQPGDRLEVTRGGW
ncbi:MAG: polysaccharide biosynthesis/export family protein [Pyrinomonadaceae bacterium]